jgi:hypothetical protein
MPITYAQNVLVDRLELPPLDKAPFMASKDLEDKRRRVFDREKAVDLMKQGYPDTQISSHLGVGRVSILNMRKNAGVAPLVEGRVKDDPRSKNKRPKIKAKQNKSKPDGSDPMPTDSLSDPQHPNQIIPTENNPKSNMAKQENVEREMNE